ncbi:MAG: uroporphyrinogen-III synthase [Pseudomonadota bacterium]
MVVTRPEQQSRSLVSALEAAGFSVLRLPMLRVEAIEPLAPASKKTVYDLDLFEHLIFVSANAAHFGLECFSDVWPQHPEGQIFWAVGEATAQVLEKKGFTAVRPKTDMSSEGLLALPGLQEVSGQRILIVKGEGGRGLLATTLENRGARVSELHAYRRSSVSHDSRVWIRRLDEEVPTLLLISSGEGVELLSRLLQPREHTNLADHVVIAPSPRVAKLANELGWRQVRTVANAADACMLSAAEEWRGQTLDAAKT